MQKKAAKTKKGMMSGEKVLTGCVKAKGVGGILRLEKAQGPVASLAGQSTEFGGLEHDQQNPERTGEGKESGSRQEGGEHRKFQELFGKEPQ